jgi:hypothetical protein
MIASFTAELVWRLHQNGNNQPLVREYAAGDDDVSSKKSRKTKIQLPCASGGTWPCGARFLRLLS